MDIFPVQHFVFGGTQTDKQADSNVRSEVVVVSFTDLQKLDCRFDEQDMDGAARHSDLDSSNWVLFEVFTLDAPMKNWLVRLRILNFRRWLCANPSK